MSYLVRKINEKIEIAPSLLTSPLWDRAETLSLDFVYGSGDHPATPDSFRPYVTFRMLHDKENICGRFRVEDRYIRIVRTGYQQDVCCDSCVEFFVRPRNTRRYFNFEFSGGGAMLLYNITDLRGKKFSPVPDADCETVRRFSTLPARVLPEKDEPVVWYFAFAIPVSFFAKYADDFQQDLSGQIWTANMTKCADETSHPSWLSWQPLPRLDFHQPDCFGEIQFE